MLKVLAKSPQMFNPIPDKCGLYLPLWHNELRGGVFSSADDFRHACTVTGALWTPQGRIFDGASYIKITTANWRSGDSVGTILAWVKTSSATDQTIFASSYEVSAGYYLLLKINSTDGKLTVIQRNNDVADSISGGTNVVDGNFHLLALVSNGTAYSMYVDTTLQDLTVIGGANTGDWLADTPNRQNVTLGVFNYSALAQYLTGTEGELWYFNRALTLAEITQIYNATKFRYL